jgi:PIN like domain
MKLYFDRSIGKSVPLALRAVGVEVAFDTERYPHAPGAAPTPDDVWIEEASRRGEVIVYKDKRIRYRPEERAAFMRAGARMFLLGGNLSRFEMLRLLMVAWPEMARLSAAVSPPFIFRIGSRGDLARAFPPEA